MSENIIEEMISALDSKFFRALAEPTRIDILKVLLVTGKSDVGGIAQRMPQDRSVISRHLNLMYEAGLVLCEKQGRHKFYEINSEGFAEKFEKTAKNIRKCMECGCKI